jgi:hypothetical protein
LGLGHCLNKGVREDPILHRVQPQRKIKCNVIDSRIDLNENLVVSVLPEGWVLFQPIVLLYVDEKAELRC